MAHAWTFFRAGGVDQVRIATGDDIAHLRDLDQKLWVALACPVQGIEFDARTLALIDEGHDGRIRAPEVVAAAEWACARLKDPEELVRGGDGLDLDALADDPRIGQPLRDEAREVLGLLGRPGATRLQLADVEDRQKLIGAMRADGDGIVTSASTDDPVLKQVLADLVAHRPADTVPVDRHGQPGVDQVTAKAFFAHVRALVDWMRQGLGHAARSPLGPNTRAAVAAIDAVRAKVDDYFARCRLAAYDVRAVAPLNPDAEQYKALATQALTLDAAPLAALPLSAVAPHRDLPLQEGLNPYWAAAMARFRQQVVGPLMGDSTTSLSEADWRALEARLAPAREWVATRPDGPAAGLSDARLEALAEPGIETAVLALIEADAQAAGRHALIVDLEKLLRLKRDLLALLRNFVSFEDFYRRQGAIFQAGTLYLDGRSCDLAVAVADAGRHALLAGMAKAYLAYCECRRGEHKRVIVAAFTAGDTDFLFVGRNGVFYDRQGNDWDATITKVIDNPTSIGQAFLAPYKKFLRLVEEQVAKRAAASEAAQQGSLGALASRVASVDRPTANGPAAAGVAAGAALPKRPPGRWDVGAVAALGVALGSFSALLVGLFGKFIELGWWIPVALAGIVVAISGPSMLIAWLKLRQRSLGPILDASGWAINGRMRINVRLGASLSQTAHVPIDARRGLRDPFAERHGLAYALVPLGLAAVAVLVAWRYSLLNPWLPEALQVPLHEPAAVLVPAAAASAP
jgi:hypothetical protein